MNINSIHNPFASTRPAAENPAASSGNSSAEGSGSAGVASSQASSAQSSPLTDTSDLVPRDAHSLRLSELPDVRPEVVSAAKEKLASGFYQTRDAAIQTARSLLS